MATLNETQVLTRELLELLVPRIDEAYNERADALSRLMNATENRESVAADVAAKKYSAIVNALENVRNDIINLARETHDEQVMNLAGTPQAFTLRDSYDIIVKVRDDSTQMITERVIYADCDDQAAATLAQQVAISEAVKDEARASTTLSVRVVRRTGFSIKVND